MLYSTFRNSAACLVQLGKFGRSMKTTSLSKPPQRATDELYAKIQDKCLKVYEGDKYIIVNKANGVDVMDYKQWKSSPSLPGLFSILKTEVDENLKNVHRIDKSVTGGLLLAKDKNVAKQFSKNLRDGGNKGYVFKRRYVAIIEDTEIDADSLGDSITFSSLNRATIETVSNGQKSTTKLMLFPKIKHESKILAVIQLETGRKHQIRMHLSGVLKRPIFNDSLYGWSNMESNSYSAIGLHSSFIYTKIGMKEEFILIPVKYATALWSGFIDEDGYYPDEINESLLNFDRMFTI